MDTPELQEFIGLVAAFRASQRKGTSPFRQMRASAELLDFFEDLPVFASVPELAPILREAKRVSQAADEEVFGRRSARAAAAMPDMDLTEVLVESQETDTCVFTSPVSAPVMLFPQPAFTPKPSTAKAQPAEPAERQPAEPAELQPAEPAELQPAVFQLASSEPGPAVLPDYSSSSEPTFPSGSSEPAFPLGSSSPGPAFPPD